MAGGANSRLVVARVDRAIPGDDSWGCGHKHGFAISRREAPEVLHERCPSKEPREQGMPGARCTRGLVCKNCAKKRTRAYRFSGNTPASPAQWLYGLYRALPGDEFVLSPSLPA